VRRAFLGLGSDAPDARARLEAALEGLERADVRVAAVSAPVSGPFVGPHGPDPSAPPVLNAVAEVTTSLSPSTLLARLHALESDAGRVRGASPRRTLDLDLLDHEGADAAARGPEAPQVPHPRALARAFVLAPWEEIAPHHVVAGASVLVHAARLCARDPAAFESLRLEAGLAPPRIGTAPKVLRHRDALALWRGHVGAAVGLVPTMGALHAGHAALVRRARAEGGPVLATIFVNPLQFGPKEDLARYPRTFESDLEVLSASGADAVYVPAPDDLYPDGFSTYVTPEGPALPFEGSVRPGHFRGVATVVLKLLLRARPLTLWLGQKDAQQVAVVRRMLADLDVPVRLSLATTVRDHDGLALSSRNRYLSPDDRRRALALPHALSLVAHAASRGERDASLLLAPAHALLTSSALTIDYLSLVDPASMAPVSRLGAAPALAVATVRVGATRLLDNRFVVAP
jgi:pantoate--beta-alanine ligase